MQTLLVSVFCVFVFMVVTTPLHGVANPEPDPQNLSESLRGINLEFADDGRVESIGSKYINFVVVDNSIDIDILDAHRRDIRQYLGVPIRLNSFSFTENGMNDFLRSLYVFSGGLNFEDAAATVLIMELNSTVGLLVAPDIRIAVVCPNWILSPNTPSDILDARLRRQLYRGIGLLFGLSYTRAPQTVMQPIRDPVELDVLSLNFSPPNVNLFMQNATYFGLRPLQTLTLRQRYLLGLLPEADAERIRERRASREAAEGNGNEADN